MLSWSVIETIAFEPGLVHLFLFYVVNRHAAVIGGDQYAVEKSMPFPSLSMVFVSFLSPELCDYRELFSVMRHEIEHFFRMFGMTMERDACSWPWVPDFLHSAGYEAAFSLNSLFSPLSASIKPSNLANPQSNVNFQMSADSRCCMED